MHKRNLFLFLILVLVMLSTSFVSANENVTAEVNDDIVSSVSDDIVIDDDNAVENIESDSNDDSSSTDQINESQITDETEKIEKAQVLSAENDEFFVDETQVLVAVDDVCLDEINNNILRATGDYYANTNDVSTLLMDIRNNQYTNVFLCGRTFTGNPGWDALRGGLSNLNVYGGWSADDDTMAYFNCGGIIFHSGDGAITNVKFKNIKADNRLFWFSGSGDIRNLVIENCECVGQFIWIAGANNVAKGVYDSNFINCRQTYDDIYDGNGQFAAVSGIYMENCNFINTSSGHHGGALCIADESDWGPGDIATKLINCNFINVTSRWFAVYIHGPFQTSTAAISEIQVLDNCKFINCTGTGEYSGGLGISHNYVQVKNTDFINCSGGQGSAIMVGGIPRFHDGFNGQNLEANYVLIDNCNFIDNVAKDNPGTFCPLLWKQLDPNEAQKPGVTYYANKGDTIPDPNGRWYIKHGDETFNTTGDAGAIYVIGNYTTIRDCTFNHNLAEGANGAAIYIYGQNTTVDNSDFYNHKCENGTIFIEGNNATIKDSTFDKNKADKFGSAIYIIGNKTQIINSDFTDNEAVKGTVFIEGKDTAISDSTFKENEADYGAGVFIEGKDTLIYDSNFTDNEAIDGAGIYANGDDTVISGSIFEDNYAYVDGGGAYVLGANTKISDSNFTNNEALLGAGVNIKGSNTNISGSVFKGNDAAFGGGAHIEGDNTLIYNSNFTHNEATTGGGGAYIDGDNTKVYSDDFDYNTALNGGGIFVKGRNTTVNDTYFDHNNVTYQGGAIYIDGSSSKFLNNNFTYNEAVPQDANEYSGLGGAIFVRGDNTLTDNNDYEHNKARNGSAIYSSGNDLTVVNDIFRENQAWSYLLMTVAEPEISLYNTSDVEIEVVHIGGDNMVNAIHNNASHNQIRLKNVTYVNNYNKELHTNEFEFEYPEDGVENSEKGTKLYQDDREYHQLLSINVTDENGNVILNTTNFTTNLYGDVYVTMPKSKLKTGKYIVNAAHPEDWNYKGIKNQTSFRILDYVDVSVEKTSDKVEYFDDDIAIWTIKVKNAANGTNATNVIVDDILPSDFEFINYTTANGTYDNHTGLWTIGFMGNGTEATLVIYALVESDIERMDHIVNINCDEKDVDISVDRVVDPVKDRYEEGDPAEWTITVTNNGNHVVHDVVLSHTFPIEFELEPHTNPVASQGTYDDHNHIWTIGDMDAGQSYTITIKSLAIANVTTITNLMVLDYKEKHLNLTVNKTSDQEEYHDGEEAIITIIVRNGEGCEATNVFLNDILRPEFEYNSHEGSDYDPTTNVWTIGNMAQKSESKLVIKTTARRIYGDVTNVAVVTCDEADWDETNNEAHRTVRVVPLPEPIKTVNNITPNYYGEVEYNLTINNTGHFPYEKNLTVIDSLPDELEYIGLVNLIGAKPLGFKQEGNKLIWNITSINPGVPTIITIKVRVVGLGNLITNKTFIDNVTGRDDIAYIGNLTNNLTVIGPNGTNKTVSRTVYPVPITDLSVDIVSDKKEYFIDDVATWTITVKNAGNGTNATYVNLTDFFNDDFHDNFVIVGWTTGNGTYDNVTGKWIIGNMTNGTEAVLVIKSLAKVPGTNIPHNATVKGVEKEWNDKNNKANKNVNVIELPDIEKTVSNKTPYYNAEIEYNLTITNKGTTQYTNNLTVVDSLPEGLKYISYVVTYATPLGFKEEGNKLTWNLTNIDPNRPALITIKVKVIGLGELITDEAFINQMTGINDIAYIGNLTNNATLTGPNGTNKKTNCTIYPVPIVDLSVDITSNKDSYFVDDVATWTITVKNAGNGTNATYVNLTDLFNDDFHDNFVIVGWTTGNGTYDNVTGKWIIGNMTNGTEAVLVIKSLAKVPGTNIPHNATVKGVEKEWNDKNNKASKTVSVFDLPDIKKTVSNNTPNYHGEILYNLTITNTGNINYVDDLILVDSLPDGLVYVGLEDVINVTVNRFDKNTLTWNLTNLKPNVPAVITIRVKVVGLGELITDEAFINQMTGRNDIAYIGNLTNNATLTGPNGTEKKDSCTVYPVPIVDVSVNITSDRDEYFIDDIATWTIIVHNAANGTNATNVNLTEVFPAQYFDIINCTTENGTYYTNNGTWNIGFMGNGTDATLVITARAKNPGKDIPNSVSVVSTEKDWDLGNNDDVDYVDVIDLPDIEKTVSNETPRYHDEILYTITVTNKGTTKYTNNLSVEDSLPDGLEFVRLEGDVTGADVVRHDSDLTWVLTNITPGTPAVIRLWVTVNAVGNLTNNATLTGPNGTNKTVNRTVEAQPYIDLSVEIGSDRDEYFVDDIAIWTITVHNAGNGTNATYVNLTDLFQDDFHGNFVIVNWTTENGTYDNATGTWIIGNMTNGTDAVLKIKTLAKTPGTNIEHIVYVAGKEKEWNYDNNKKMKPVDVIDLPDIEKTVSNETPRYHDEILYTITVTNKGTTKYTNNLSVEDSLPDGLEFVRLEGDVTGADVVRHDSDLTWVLTNITPGTPAVIRLWVTVNAVGNLTNNATLTGPNGTEKKVNRTVEAQPYVDLSVNKTADKDWYYYHDIVVWTITVENAGNGTNATFVSVADFFPADKLEFVNCTVPKGTFYDNQTHVWTIGNMANGTNLTLVIKSRAIVTGDIPNAVHVDVKETDWDPDNNDDDYTVNVLPLIDVSVNITSDKDEYFVDDVATWIIIVHNAANGTNATNVNLTEVFPAQYFDIINCTTDNGTYYSNNGTWNIGFMGNGTDAVLVITARAKNPGMDIPNSVSVVASEKDWDLDNNDDENLVDIVELPDIEKTVVDKEHYYYHDEVDYNITIINRGTTNYTNELTVVDSLPKGLDFVKVVSVTGADVVGFDEGSLTWVLTNITPETPAVITVRVRITEVDNLTNNATLTGPNGTEKKVDSTIESEPYVDISVVKTSDKDEYFVDDIAIWTIVVHNAANGTNATGVYLVDNFPGDNFEIINLTTNNGTVKRNIGSQYIWNIGFMGNGTNATLTIVSRATEPRKEIYNFVYAFPNENEWDQKNNFANKSVDVVDLPDINKTASDYEPNYKDEILYNLTITNTGTTNYTNKVTVVDSLPKGLEYLSIENITGAKVISFVKEDNTLTWVLTNIEPETPAVITLRFRVTEVGNLTNNLTLIGPNGTEKMVDCTVDVQPIVDISVVKTSDKDEYFVDDIATWTIVVHNAANGTNATDVHVGDFFPSNFFEIINYTTDNGTFEAGLWNIGFMGNGTDATLTIVSRAKVARENVINMVIADCNETDWNTLNNIANKTVDVVDLPEINKTASDYEPYYHDEILYNLTITNTGTTVYENELTVVDSLPKGLEFISVENIVGANVVSFDKSALTWVLTNIKPGKPAVITLRFRVTEVGNLTNNLTLVGPNGTEKMVDCTVDVQPLVDVSVEKTSDEDEYFVDDIATWTIVVHNAANGTNATNVFVGDFFPFQYFEIINYTTDNGTFESGLWNIGFMGNGTDVTLTIVSRAKVVRENIRNVAFVVCNETDWNKDNNIANKTVDIIDLPAINKTASDYEPYYKDEILYNLTITNTGREVYENELTVVDSLPKGLEFISVENIVGANVVSFDKSALTWVLTNIKPGKPAVITLRFRVTEVGNLTNNLTLIGPAGTEKMVDCTVDVQPLVDVSVNITSDEDEYFVDDIATWTIIVHNAANGTNATNVNLTEVFPAEYFDIISCTTENGTYYSNNGTWNIGFMGNGTDATLVITARAKNPGTGIENSVSVVSTEEDWNLDNNDDLNVVDIVEIPEPAKSAFDYEPYYHDEVLYNLTITNTGNEVYENNLTVVDSLPKGLDFIEVVSVTGADVVSFDKSALTWVLTNIKPGKPAVITLRFRVTEVGNLTNNLTLVGPNGTEKTVNCTVDVKPLVDISVNKTTDRDVVFKGDFVSWTITVHNAWNGTNATNVRLIDALPEQVAFFMAIPLNGTFNSTTRVWDIGFMGNGTDARLIVIVIANATGNASNTAFALAKEKDWNIRNNLGNSTIEIVDMPDPVKTVSEDKPHYHDEILYNLTIINSASVDYISVLTVIDSLPEGLEFIRTENITGAAAVLPERIDGQIITWYLTNITPDEPAVITVRVRVNEVGNFTNNLTICTIFGHNKTVNCTVEAQPLVDVSTTIDSDKEVYFAGDFAVWTIRVHNAGNGTNATGVILDEFFPFQYFEYAGFMTDNGTYDNESRVWDIGFMGNGTDAILYVFAYAKAPGEHINNAVVVDCDEDDWNPENNFAYNYVDVLPRPVPEKIVENPTPLYNDEILYFLKVTNAADITYGSPLVVADYLPEGLEFIRTVSITGADVIINGTVHEQNIVWVITNITADEPAVITVLVKVNALGNLTNNLTIVTLDGTRTTVNCTVEPVPFADLEVTNIVSNKSVRKGDTVTWNITVVNHGPNLSENVYVKDILPEGLIFVNAEGDYDPETGIWTIGDLDVGESISLVIVSIVNITNANITDIATVNSTTYDPDMSNNVANNTTVVPPEADIGVVKEVNAKECVKDQIVEWTITMSNYGPDGAENVLVKDNLPDTLIFISADGNYDPETGIWTIDYLASGETRVLHIITKVNTTNQVIVNNATVTSGTYDPNMRNNKANNSTVALPEADLAITIVPNVTKVMVGEKVQYKVTVANLGPDTAVNTRATVKLPDELKLLGFKPSKGTYDPETGIWTIGDVAPGEEITLLLDTEALVAGKIVVDASVVSDTYDRNLSNNNDSAEITVDVIPPQPIVSPEEPPVKENVPTMPATGNPIAMVILALLAMVGMTLRRRN